MSAAYWRTEERVSSSISLKLISTFTPSARSSTSLTVATASQ